MSLQETLLKKYVLQIVRHGQAVSNLGFVLNADGTLGEHLLYEAALEWAKKHYPGRNFFRVPLTPAGIARSIAEGREQFKDPKVVQQISAIFSSPLERCIQTALLMTPIKVFKKCGWKITILPQLQEALKYPCDLVSSKDQALAQLRLMKEQYIAQLEAEGGHAEDVADLRKNDFDINWDENMGWKYGEMTYGVEDKFRGVRPCEILSETPELLQNRAWAAREFFRDLVNKDTGGPKHYLAYTSGQILEFFTQKYTAKIDNCARVEMVIEKGGQPEVIDESPQNQGAIRGLLEINWSQQLDEAIKDAEKRYNEGLLKDVAEAKQAFIKAMGRTVADYPENTNAQSPFHTKATGNELPVEYWSLDTSGTKYLPAASAGKETMGNTNPVLGEAMLHRRVAPIRKP